MPFKHRAEDAVKKNEKTKKKNSSAKVKVSDKREAKKKGNTRFRLTG